MNLFRNKSRKMSISFSLMKLNDRLRSIAWVQGVPEIAIGKPELFVPVALYKGLDKLSVATRSRSYWIDTE